MPISMLTPMHKSIHKADRRGLRKLKRTPGIWVQKAIKSNTQAQRDSSDRKAKVNITPRNRLQGTTKIVPIVLIISCHFLRLSLSIRDSFSRDNSIGSEITSPRGLPIKGFLHLALFLPL